MTHENYPQAVAGEVAPLDRRGLAVAAALSVLLMLVLALRVDPLTENHPGFAHGDHLAYIGMAGDPGETSPPPFSYRVLVPTLARLLPFGRTASFYLITALSLLATGTLLYVFLRRMGESHFYSLIGVVFFYSLNWGAKFLLHDFWLVEGALFLFAVLALLLHCLDKRFGVVLALTLGVLTKESALFFLPLLYGFRANALFDGRAVRRTLVESILPLSAFVLLRWLIPSTAHYEPVQLFREIGLPRVTAGLEGFIRGGTVGTWGVSLIVFALLSGPSHRRFAARSSGFLFLVYLQPLFAINVDRLLVLAFPVVVPLAVAGLRRIAVRFSLARWMILGYAAIPYLLVAVKNGWQSPAPEKSLLYLTVWTIIIASARLLESRRAGTTDANDP